MLDQREHVKAGIRAQVGHPTRVINRQFRHIKVRNLDLGKKTGLLHTKFARDHLWMLQRGRSKKYAATVQKFAPPEGYTAKQFFELIDTYLTCNEPCACEWRPSWLSKLPAPGGSRRAQFV